MSANTWKCRYCETIGQCESVDGAGEPIAPDICPGCGEEGTAQTPKMILQSLRDFERLKAQIERIADHIGVGYDPTFDFYLPDDPEKGTITARWQQRTCGCCNDYDDKEREFPISYLGMSWDDISKAEGLKTEAEKRIAAERERQKQIADTEYRLAQARRRAQTAQAEATAEAERIAKDLARLKGGA